MGKFDNQYKELLFIDEIHTIIGAGGAEGAIDAANILKPSLARGEIQLIGATTREEYRKYIEKDAALERRFQPVEVNEPDEAGALDILKGLRPCYEEHHQVQITDGALVAAVKMTERYVNDRFLPDKALDLLDEAAARLRIHRAGMLESGMRASRRLMLTQREVQQAAGAMTGLAVGQGLSAERLENGLRQSVVGQQEAVEKVIHAILRSNAGLRDPRRPIGSFLFLGPSGQDPVVLRIGQNAVRQRGEYHQAGYERIPGAAQYFPAYRGAPRLCGV